MMRLGHRIKWMPRLITRVDETGFQLSRLGENCGRRGQLKMCSPLVRKSRHDCMLRFGGVI